MKQHLERYGIYYLIGMVTLIGIAVCFVAYRPIVGTELSDDNADWGNFGAFFWGFGTMCFTMLNVIVFYIISQRLYRKQIYEIYRDAFNSLLSAYILQNEKCNENDEIEFDSELTKSLINITGILGGISESHSYKNDVEKCAAKLMDIGSNFAQGATKGAFRKYVSELAGFQICLLNNHVAHSLKEYLNNKNVLQAQ